MSSREIGEVNSRVALEPAGSPVRYPCAATVTQLFGMSIKECGRYMIGDRHRPYNKKLATRKICMSHLNLRPLFIYFFSLPAAERLVVFSHQDISILRVPSKVW